MWEKNYLILYNKFHIIITNKIITNYVNFSFDSKLYIFNAVCYTLALSLVCVCPLVYMCIRTSVICFQRKYRVQQKKKPCGFEIK